MEKAGNYALWPQQNPIRSAWRVVARACASQLCRRSFGVVSAGRNTSASQKIWEARAGEREGFCRSDSSVFALASRSTKESVAWQTTTKQTFTAAQQTPVCCCLLGPDLELPTSRGHTTETVGLNAVSLKGKPVTGATLRLGRLA